MHHEGATDVGGPYNESLSQICVELHQPSLNLLLPCPNRTEGIGYNQNKFLPNPGACSPTQLSQFEFLGKLIGIAIRTKHNIYIAFPPLVWKTLVGLKTDRSALEHIDNSLCQYLDSIRENMNEETFSDTIFETFTARSIDGRIIELIPNGKNISVTWTNRLEFVSAVEQYHLNAYQAQIRSIFIGLGSIIPLSYLKLFLWQELEYRVCGNPGIDITLLKKRTWYRGGLKETDTIVLHFWEVLASFSAEDQTLFLRFVWGRSRLPPESEFNINFILQSFDETEWILNLEWIIKALYHQKRNLPINER